MTSPDTSGNGAKEIVETEQEKKIRILAPWKDWKSVDEDPVLHGLFDRRNPVPPDKDISQVLKDNGYADRTKISDLEFKTWQPNLNPKFVKDGYVYLLRGDHPGLLDTGFYTYPYTYTKLNTQQTVEHLQSSQEVDRFLYHDDRYAKVKPSSSSTAQHLAYSQSAVGRSTFISTTTDIPCAEAGTGNDPDPEEQNKYNIYVLRVPVDSVIKSNTDNYFGMNEEEYLVPDRILPDEIIGVYKQGEREKLYTYLNKLLSVSRADVGLEENL